MPGKAIPKVIKKPIIEAIDAGESVRKFPSAFMSVFRVLVAFTRDDHQNQLLMWLVKINPFKTVVYVYNYTHDYMGVAMSTRTARRILVRVGLCARKPAKKPFISAKNIKARLAFAIDHKDWTIVAE
uniref:Transposase Tc1-like domain-containing protein n=1 Tax=Acrobeloides nanus TaxID=290746 RepID=A0A914CSW4_9BILA